MTTPPPLDIFSAELLSGETIEWTGRPNPSVIFHREDLFTIPFSFMWGGFAIFWFLGASGLLPLKPQKDQAFEIFGVIWGTPFVVIGQYLIWGRFVYARWKKRRTYYALTNRRALIVTSGFLNRSSSAVMLDSLSMIDKRIRSDGIGSIAFGGPVAADFQMGKRQTPRPPTFEDIDNADFIYQTILRLQDQARKLGGATQSRW